MKINGSDAKTKINAVAKSEKPKTLSDWLRSHQDSLEVAIPKGTMDIDRFMQSALLAIYDTKSPNLAICSPESIFRSLKESASLGLEVGGVLGQAYLIPYNESMKNAKGQWEKVMTCHFQMGYKGLITLARRSNTIKTIAAECIYENDIFEVQLGMNRNLSHKIDIFKERGEVVGYYCLVELVNGGSQFVVLSKKDIEQHRDKFSKAYKKDDPSNIWNKNFDAMALKTCVIKCLKLCPISIEALEAVRKEELKDVEGDSVVNQPEPKLKQAENVQDAEFTVNESGETKPTEEKSDAEVMKEVESELSEDAPADDGEVPLF